MDTTFQLPNVSSRQELVHRLDGYVAQRSEELATGERLKHELVKSYLIETGRGGATSDDLRSSLSESRWDLAPIESGLFRVSDSEGFAAYLESIDDRHLALYTIDTSDRADRAVSRLVARNTLLDRLWFSGIFMHALWSHISASHDPLRFVRMRFEFDELFGALTPDEPLDTEADIARVLERAPERRASVFVIGDRLQRARHRLPQFQQIEEAFEDMTLLRMPAVGGRGGHDVYYTGKVTNRADSFAEHRQQLLFLVNAYRRVTERIEDSCLFSVRDTRGNGDRRLTLDGAPITFSFDTPIRPDVFANFLKVTFDQGRAPFRILGRAIQVGPDSYHVYGVDMHLWQEIWLDLTRRQWTLVLPKGTCGNTVSRFAANIQRFVDPRVRVEVAGVPLQQLARDALASA